MKLGYGVTSPSLGRKVESDRMLNVSKLLLSYSENDVTILLKALCNQPLIDDTPATGLVVDNDQIFATISCSVLMGNFVGCKNWALVVE